MCPTYQAEGTLEIKNRMELWLRETKVSFLDTAAGLLLQDDMNKTHVMLVIVEYTPNKPHGSWPFTVHPQQPATSPPSCYIRCKAHALQY
jgi:hypothetical protein